MVKDFFDKYAQVADIPEPPKNWKQVSSPAVPKSNTLPSGVVDSGGEVNIIPKNQRQSENVSVSPDAAMQSISSVKAMQQAVINFARYVANHQIHSVPDRQTTKGETLTGSNPFMNFLVSAYMNKAKTQGKQLVNTDEKQPTRMETSKELDNFKGVLQSIGRIGSHGTEQKPDGIWGERTNSALKNIYALAFALVSVQNDMNIQISNYTDKDLSELYNNIPQDITNLDTSKKAILATALAKNIDKLRALYDNFREKVLNNQTYQAQIAQEKPLMSNKNEVKSISQVLSKEEQDTLEQNQNSLLNTKINGRDVVIKPSVFSSLDAFKEFLKNASKSGALSEQELANALSDNGNELLQHYLKEAGENIS